MSGILDFFRSAGKDPYREALHATSAGDDAKAADILAGMAAEYVTENAMICAGYCGQAALSYLKADNLGKAREQERGAIEVLHKAGYLKAEDNQIDILWKAVCTIYSEGFEAEAAFFVEQINQKLALNRSPLIIRIEAQKESKNIIVECGHCGATFKAVSGTETNCPYCQCAVSV